MRAGLLQAFVFHVGQVTSVTLMLLTRRFSCACKPSCQTVRSPRSSSDCYQWYFARKWIADLSCDPQRLVVSEALRVGTTRAPAAGPNWARNGNWPLKLLAPEIFSVRMNVLDRGVGQPPAMRDQAQNPAGRDRRFIPVPANGSRFYRGVEQPGSSSGS
jgi:hypothetical protein